MGPVALLRGANRPLLTKLVESEVRIETADEPRDRIEIDFRDYLCRIALHCSMELSATK